MKKHLSFALAAALMLISCTSSRDTAEGPRATAGGATPQATTDEETPGGNPNEGVSPGATPTEDPFVTEGKDVLRVAVREPATLDPLHIQDPASVLIARQIFEGLTRWDVVAQEVVPALASWSVTDGGRTFTFKLREDAVFHDGEPVTAQDFVFAFDRIAQKKNASDVAYTLERIEGFVDVNQLGRSKHLSGLEARDKQTLVIRLSEPFFDFPAVLTHPALVPLQKDEVEDDLDRFLARPVGNGPFELTETWSPGDPVTVERFDDFYDPVALDAIRFVPFADAASSWLPFLDEELDVSEVPVDQIDVAEDTYGATGFRGLLNGYYFGMNVESKSLRDVVKRRAVSLAIDRPAIAKTVFKGTLQPPRGIVPEGMPGFEIDVCTEFCEFDFEEARRLVEKLPAKDRSITIDYTRGEPHDEVAAMVSDYLEAVGFNVTLDAYGFSRYVRRLRDGDQSMYRLGWLAEYPTPDAFLSDLFASGAPDNHSGFSSTKVDRLLASAHAERSPDKRADLYLRAERAILTRAPIVPLGSFVTHWAAQPNVEGLQFDQMGGFDALDVSLTE